MTLISRRPITGARYLSATDPSCAAGRHGNATAYANNRCRCPEAREDWRVYNKRRREGRHRRALVDSTGTARRLHCLAWHGYGATAVASRLGIARRHALDLTTPRSPRVHRDTASAVVALYDALTALPPAIGPAATAARAVARRKGWPPPAAWDDDTIDDPNAEPCIAPEVDEPFIDEVAVHRAARGDDRVMARLTDAERDAVALRMLAAGIGYRHIGTQLGLSERYIRALRNAHAITGRSAAA